MSIQPEDIVSMTDFKRDTAAHLRRLKKTRRPGVLTINGKAAAVVMDAAAYQRMVDQIEMTETVDAVHRSMKEFEQGRGMPAREALERARRRRKAS